MVIVSIYAALQEPGDCLLCCDIFTPGRLEKELATLLVTLNAALAVIENEWLDVRITAIG